jgi:hypothetical protein
MFGLPWLRAVTPIAVRRRFFRGPAGRVCGRGAWPQRRVALDPGEPIFVQRKYPVSACAPKALNLTNKQIGARQNNAMPFNACVQSRPLLALCGDWPISQLSLVERATHYFIVIERARPRGVYMQIRLMRPREEVIVAFASLH